MSSPIPFERQTASGITNGSVIEASDETDNVLSRLPHYDLISFLAIAERIPDLRFYTFAPYLNDKNVIGGASGIVHQVELSPILGIVFKRFKISSQCPSHVAYKALISELMVLTHPAFAKHPNLPDLYGVTWDVQVHEGRLIQLMPSLVLRRAENGTLAEYLACPSGRRLSFGQRLSLCTEVASALEAMHAFNIVHGDIKPENVLIYEGEGGVPIAKVIDFGCSCFGSSETDRVKLSFTPEWVAPEWKQGAFTIQEAKKTDMYSFGKLCAWVLFANGIPLEDFAFSPFNFREAAQGFFCSFGHGSRGILGSSYQEAEAFLSLERFFALSFTHESNERAPKFRILVDLLSQTSYGLRANETKNNICGRFATFARKHSVSLGFRRFNHYLRAQSGHFLAFCLLGGKSEFFAPGQTHARLYISRVEPFVALVALVIWLVGLFGFVVPYLPKFRKIRSGGLLCLVLAVALGAMPFFLFAWYPMESLYLWTELRVPSQLFLVFGHRQHLIPRLARLFPMFNELHYSIRVQIVNDLTAKANGDCVSCRQPAALQLALCHELAFGTSRDVETSRSWLLRSGHNEDRFPSFLKEVAHFDWNSSHDASLQMRGEHLIYDNLYNIAVAQQYVSTNLTSDAVRILREEIKGKGASGVSINSQAKLSECLGAIFLAVGSWQDAEQAFRQVIRLENKIGKQFLFSYHNITAIARAQHDRGTHPLLARALVEQYRYGEAIDVLMKARPYLMRNPNGKLPIWSFTSKPANRDMPSRMVLVECLIKSERLNEVLRMDIASDLRDLLGFVASNTPYVAYGLWNMASFGEALFSTGRVYPAAKILRERLRICEDIFDQESQMVRSAQTDLASVLTQLCRSDIDEAIKLYDTLLSARSIRDDFQQSSVMYAKAFAVTRKGQCAEGLMTMRMVLEKRVRDYGLESWRTMGCMRELAMSICEQDENDLDKPAALQMELVDSANHEPHAGVQMANISLLYSLSRPHALDEAVMLATKLLELQRQFRQSDLDATLRTQGHLIFLLSHQGCAFGDHTKIFEATKVAKSMLRTIRERYGNEHFEHARAMRILASTQSKCLKLMCDDHGFDQSGMVFMEETVSISRNAFELSGLAFGSQNDETLAAAVGLACALSQHGIRFRNFTEMAEAENLLGQVLDATSLKHGHASIRTTRIEARLEAARYEHGKVGNEDAKTKARAILNRLQHTLHMYHPQTILQRRHLARILDQQGEELEAGSLMYSNCNILRETFGSTHPSLFDSLHAVGRVYTHFRPEAALRDFNLASWSAQHCLTGGIRHPSALNYKLHAIEQQDIVTPNEETNVTSATELVRIWIDTFGKAHTSTIDAMNRLGSFYLRRGNKDQAIGWKKEALEQSIILLGIVTSDYDGRWREYVHALGFTNEESDGVQIRAEREILTPLQLETKEIAVGVYRFDLKDFVHRYSGMLALSTRTLGSGNVVTEKTAQLLGDTLAENQVMSTQSAQELVDSLRALGQSAGETSVG